ncbi:SGNH/GDSL hydrolase family protein [Roseiarcaceae bacterium H3SJ34-1]|uniref:SGNH/GDSL hydrolase family protein n=1 Tax=Terripilifer ovatus TaxID=3032367 RepID=UPI003AB9B029|nr:SGNH/GDSL hydrolase family protein [Roseiarcaceae bacterium H3SJ34-1]
MASLRDVLVFCTGLAAVALAWLLVEHFILQPRRKRNLIRRDTNRIALAAAVRVSQIDDPFVLVTGDSLVSQLLLAPVSNLAVVDIAFPGLTSSEFADRIGPIMSAKRPVVTVLSIGANDALQRDMTNGTERAGVIETVGKIGGIVEGSQATLLLSLPRLASAHAHHSTSMDRLAEELRTFAAARNWIFFDCAAALAAVPMDQLTSDGLHLSPQANGVLARALRQAVRGLVANGSAMAANHQKPSS